MRVARSAGPASVVLVVRTDLVLLAHSHAAAHLLVTRTAVVGAFRSLDRGLITITIAALGLVGLSVFDAHDLPQEAKFIESGVDEVCNLVNEILQLGVLGEKFSALLHELLDLFQILDGIFFEDEFLRKIL